MTVIEKEHKPAQGWIQGYYETEKENEEDHL